MSKLVDEQHEFLQDFVRLINFATSLGFQITSGELLRTVDQQKIYVETGRSKTMNSNHLRKLAGDLNFFKEGKYICTVKDLAPLGEFWESLSPKNRWGGNFSKFKDAPHFERNV